MACAKNGANDTLPGAVPRKSPLAVLFLTVFVDLLGFGILIPILPSYAKSFGASATMIGLLGAIYSLAQMLFAPVWGRVSDRVGRRPVILVTAAGACVSYLVFGFAEALWLLFVARAFAGACGANISTAQAYVADVTTPADRARGMGMIGAALGLGFTLGPAIGGLAAHWGGKHAPFFVAAGLAAVNFVWAYVALPEPERHSERARRGLSSYADALRVRELAFFIFVYLLVTFAFSHIETAYVLFNHDELGFGERENGLMFTLIGVIMVIMQMSTVRPLTARYGSKRLIVAGTAICATGALLMPFATVWWHLLPATVLIAVGNALFSPSLSAVISVAAPADRQGEMLGVSQSAGAIGRIGGPSSGGLLYDHAGHAWPFWVCAALLYLGALATGTEARRTRSTRTPTEQ